MATMSEAVGTFPHWHASDLVVIGPRIILVWVADVLHAITMALLQVVDVLHEAAKACLRKFAEEEREWVN